MSLRLFTSESVTEGHPDKICDQISDSILDALIAEDPNSRVAVETLVTTGLVHVAGEVRTDGYVDIPGIVRRVVNGIGYTSSETGFDGDSCGVTVSIGEQSGDIAAGVDTAIEHREGGSEDPVDALGAGDQGIMFGFACDETPDLMPATLYYSHKILEQLATDRHSGAAPFLEPDAKSQVTLRYHHGKPVAATAIVVSTQHKAGYDEGAKKAELEAYVKQAVGAILPEGFITGETVWHINPTGSFEIGGPDGDAGLTGRKIIVDTYGGAAPHGGGAFSGKDPTKVDRSAAYVSRYLAKNVVAAGLATRVTIQLSYAIGVARPLSLYVDTAGTGTVSDAALEAAIAKVAEEKLGGLTPRGIRLGLGLNKPIYGPSAAYGHFGRTPDGDFFPWERADLVDALKAALA